MESVTILPPGFQFCPTDEELICYYLRNKVTPSKSSSSQSLPELIRDVDVFGFDPVDLLEKAGLAAGDGQWFFFTERRWSDTNGGKWSRTTERGVWKMVCKDSLVVSKKEGVVGMKKTLVFYRGNPPYYTETFWMMNEYVLVHCGDRSLVNKDSFAICRVFLNPYGRRQRLNNCGLSFMENNHVGTSSYHCDDILAEQVDETTISSTGEVDIEEGSVSDDDELQRILMAMLDAEDDSYMLQSSVASLHQEMLGFDYRDQGYRLHASDELPPAILEGDFIELNDLIPPVKEHVPLMADAVSLLQYVEGLHNAAKQFQLGLKKEA